MKYSLFFAATVAAYDAYGEYGAQQSNSMPAKFSSSAKVSSSAPVYGGYDQHATSMKTSSPASKATPCSTTIKGNGYATVVPGYGKSPVTVTQQYQVYPTCIAKGYNGQSCEQWGEDKYVSTTITDCNKQIVTITNVQDYVTVYQEKQTITHSATPTVAGYGAVSTPVVSKNQTTIWYELYEQIIVIQYQEAGKNAMAGWTGSGLCQECDSSQPITQKEYKSGKWTEEKKTLNYGKPKDEVKVYEKPGVYTIPGKVVTVYASQSSGKPSYSYDTYSINAKIVTITKSNQPYTCTYEVPKQTPSKTPSKGEGYPVTVTKTPAYNNGYGNGYAGKPTSTPWSEDRKSMSTSVTVSKPVHSDNVYGAKSTSTPVVYYGDDYKPSSFTPSKPSSTPCDEDKKSTSTPTPSKPAYDDSYGSYPTPTASKPTYNDSNGSYAAASKPVYNDSYTQPTPTPAKPVYNDSGYGGYTAPTAAGYVKRGSMVERRNAKY